MRDIVDPLGKIVQNTQISEQDPAPKPTDTYSYVAYGLGLHSNIPIPEFSPANIASDIQIHCDPTAQLQDHIPEAVLSQKVAIQVTPESAIIYLKNTGAFLLNQGQAVTVIPTADATPEQVRHALYGIVMAVILHQRGRFVLHGSAVNIGGKAYAFLGHSGEGKSSMAAALHAQGYPLLTDDLVAVTLGDSPTLTTAGTPIKLYPEMATRIGITTPGQPLPTRLPKQRFTLDQAADASSIPLAGIYELKSGSPLQITPLVPADSIKMLLQHAGLNTMLPSSDPALFLQSTQLAQVCPTFELQRPRDLNQFPQVLEAVQAHIRQQNGLPDKG